MPLFASSALHEFYAVAHDDGAALCGLASGVARRRSRAPDLLWIRDRMCDRELGSLSPSGIAEYGFDPSRMIVVRPHDSVASLQAALEGARVPGLDAVLVELWGAARTYDLTASRRLALAARTSGVPVLMMRIAAIPAPSAAETRWLVRAIPSRALAAKAPGAPAFELTLLRARNGQEGLRYHLEWDRDAKSFTSHEPGRGEQSATGIARYTAGYTPLSRAVVPVSFDRSGLASDRHLPQQRTG